MSLRLLRSGLAWACAVATGLTACSGQPAADTVADEPPATTPAPGAEILYVGESPLTLGPGERARLPFAIRPRGHHEVRFALTGDFGDAALDVGTATSDADGNVSVELTAPSTSRTFIVRATLPLGASAEVAISVSGLGFGSIEVVPSYSGKRTLGRIVGTVTTGASCADLVGIPPPDGPLVAQANHPRSPVVNDAPVGPALVVTARAGYFAGGCMEVKGLRAGETKSVTVPMLDRPLQFREPVAVRFALEGTDDVRAWLEASSRRVASAFAGASDVASLLDAMSEALPNEHKEAFAAAREQSPFEAVLTAFFDGALLSFASVAEELLLEGLESLPLASGIAGTIEPSTSEGATFQLQSIFDLPQTGSVPLTFAATADDVVHLGGHLSFSPLVLLADAALAPARERVPSADSVVEALTRIIDCDAVTEALFAVYPDLGTCDEACLRQACVEGIIARWQAALDEPEPATWKLTASGDAKVGNEAELRGIEGSWVGSIEQGPDAISVKGSTHGGP